MASKVPTVRQVAWKYAILHILIIVLIKWVYHLLGFEESFIYAALTYVLLSYVLRNLIPKDHTQGMRLVKQQKFADAIPLFEKSVKFFTTNSWVDRYRFLTILSLSKMMYKEMGLCNIAFCYSQIGNPLKSKEYYERTLIEFPENGLAKAAMNLFNSLGQVAQSKGENL